MGTNQEPEHGAFGEFGLNRGLAAIFLITGTCLYGACVGGMNGWRAGGGGVGCFDLLGSIHRPPPTAHHAPSNVRHAPPTVRRPPSTVHSGLALRLR